MLEEAAAAQPSPGRPTAGVWAAHGGPKGVLRRRRRRRRRSRPRPLLRRYSSCCSLTTASGRAARGQRSRRASAAGSSTPRAGAIATGATTRAGVTCGQPQPAASPPATPSVSRQRGSRPRPRPPSTTGPFPCCRARGARRRAGAGRTCSICGSGHRTPAWGRPKDSVSRYANQSDGQRARGLPSADGTHIEDDGRGKENNAEQAEEGARPAGAELLKHLRGEERKDAAKCKAGRSKTGPGLSQALDQGVRGGEAHRIKFEPARTEPIWYVYVSEK